MIISKYDVPQDRTPDPELREFRGVRIPEIRKQEEPMKKVKPLKENILILPLLAYI